MSAPQNPYAPWKLPVIGPLWVIQITIPVAYFIGIPIVATSKPGWHAGMDVWAGIIMASSSFVIVTNIIETFLFRKRQLNTRTYLISQWAKGAAFGVVWVVIGILLFSSHWNMLAVGEYSLYTFVLQHPGIIAGLYYASRAYAKYGEHAGAGSLSQDATAREFTALLRDGAGEV